MPFFVAPTFSRLLRSGPIEGVDQGLARLAAGDASALDALYRLEAGPVYRFVLALCGNASWAADATHDAFVALAARPQAFDPKRGTLGAYLAGAARHALLATHRDARRHEPWPEAEDEAGALGVDPASPEALLVHEQDVRRMWEALRSLPWPQREAIVLVDLQGRTYDEAARIAGIEINTLRTRLHRGRLRLAERLAASGGDAP